MKKLLILLILGIVSPVFGGNCLIYLPKDCRQHNVRASCVFASVTNCMRAAHLWDEAEQFWGKYRGCPWGEDPRGLKQKLDKFGLEYEQITDGSEEFLIHYLELGRPIAVSWGGAHMVNLVGKIDGNAYLVDNERPEKYRVIPWQKFLSSYRRSGSWAVVILAGRTSKPIVQKNLEGFETMFQF